MSRSRSAVLDATVVGAGLVLLVAGFLPWYQVTVDGPLSVVRDAPGRTAWDVSAAWWMPVVAGTATAGLWLLRRLGQLAPRWLPAVTALVGGIGLALVVGRWLTLPTGGSDYGWFAYAPADVAGPVVEGVPGLGLLLAGAALAAQLVAALLTLRRAAVPAGPP